MSIQSVLSISPNMVDKTSTAQNQSTPAESQQSFKEMLNTAISEVNTAQLKSDALTEKLVRGENVELHEVMIAAQKATITLNATMEVRNKVVEAYQEIIRMPV